MKRFIAFILVALVLTITFSGCIQAGNPPNSGSGSTGADSGKLSIVATIFPPYDFTRQLTDGKADVAMLLPPASESHSFEPTPQDIIKIQNCDIFIYVGGESDEWVTDVLESMDTSHMKVITMMDCVDRVEEEIVEGMEDGEESEKPADTGEPEEPEYDEHVWTSPKNAKLIVRKISGVLCEVDAKNASFYKQNEADYLAKLDELDKAFQNVVNNAKRRTIVFGDRFPFRYFADAYGLTYFAAFPGCSTETEASAATVKFLIDKINKEKIPVVFHIELSNEKMANTISENTGAKVMLLHACHNISKSDFEKGVGYLDLMKQNVENLKEALS